LNSAFPAEAPIETRRLLEQAKQEFQAGQREKAINTATRMIKGDPENPSCYFLRARFYELEGKREPAVKDYSKIIEMAPFSPEAYYHRGTLNFLLGRIPESVADYNMLLEAQPDRAAHIWQRGIALYYDGKYEEGRKQFELHRTVNPRDVENSAWHFLCVARSRNLEEARKLLIPVIGDPRTPMKEVLDLYAGKATPEQVLIAAEDSNSPSGMVPMQQVYAHLYIALLFEAEGNKELTRTHLQRAVDLNLKGEYMWEVARVHLDLLNSGQLK
jgi:lipoprotein NlpI